MKLLVVGITGGWKGFDFSSEYDWVLIIVNKSTPKYNQNELFWVQKRVDILYTPIDNNMWDGPTILFVHKGV